MSTTEIFESARKLRPVDRLKLIDALMESLDEPDPAIEAAWAVEARDRLAAYERRELPLGDLAPVIARYR
jgi:Putative addiction module component